MCGPLAEMHAILTENGTYTYECDTSSAERKIIIGVCLGMGIPLVSMVMGGIGWLIYRCRNPKSRDDFC